MELTSIELRRAACAAIWLCAVNSLTYAQQPKPEVTAPTLVKGAPVVTVPYSRAIDFHNLRGLNVRLAFNGGEPHGFLIDTGSVGIMVPADEIPGFDGKGEPDSITYSSSGLRLDGVRAVVDVSFPDAKNPDGKPVVAHMPVLAVTKRTCTGHGTNSAGCSEEGSAHMLGVGFGRGKDELSVQQKNAFVMLNAMQDGSMRRGYILSRSGVQLGLNTETADPGYVYQKLDPRPSSAAVAADFKGPKDYVTAAGSFEVEGNRSGKGTVLMDTGLTNMMLAVPNGPQTGDVRNGVKVQVNLLGGKLHYDFVVNDAGNPTTPRRVSWVNASHGVYVNTGLRALALFDYLYDADGGFLGLRPVSDAK